MEAENKESTDSCKPVTACVYTPTPAVPHSTSAGGGRRGCHFGIGKVIGDDR